MTYHQISAPHISRQCAVNCFAAPRAWPAAQRPWRAVDVGVYASDFDQWLERWAVLDALRRSGALRRRAHRRRRCCGRLSQRSLAQLVRLGRRPWLLHTSWSVHGTPICNAGAHARPLYCVRDRLSCADSVQTHTTAWFNTSSFSGSRSTTARAQRAMRTSSRSRACGACDAQARRRSGAKPSSSLAC